MKTTFIPSLLRLATLATALAVVPALATAADRSTTDRAAQLLATHGTLPLQAVGRYVERGTFRIQVLTKLGRPDVTLADATWLYHNRTIEGSMLRATLVVRFVDGRVSDLALATPAVVTALQAGQKPRTAEFLAKK